MTVELTLSIHHPQHNPKTVRANIPVVAKLPDADCGDAKGGG